MKQIILLITFASLLLAGCEQPMDPVIQTVNETNSVLQKHHWHLKQFTVETKRDDIPAPVLWNLSDSLLPAGIYDLDEMIFDISDITSPVHKFTAERDIVALDKEFDLLTDSIGRYFVFNDRTIRITNSIRSLNYRYRYDNNAKTIAFTLTSESASSLIEDINHKLIDHISDKTPNKIGETIAKVLYNNEGIQRIINDALVSWIAGKTDLVNEIDPEELAETLAEEILKVLQGIDWESELTKLIKTELDNITNIDAEKLSQEISSEIAGFINEQLSLRNIYDLVLPFMDQLVSNPESSAEKISSLLVNLVFKVFNEENLQSLVSDAWRKFTKLDDDKVKEIADTLTYFIEDIWVNQENISNLLLPATQKIDETSILKMGQLADEATESVKGLIDDINTLMPDLNLEPDYVQMSKTLKTAFVAAKPLIGLAGGPEKAAQEAAGLILNNLLTSELISNTFVQSINTLQSLDPEKVGTTIAAWLVGLEDKLSPVIIQYLADLFSPILENMNPEFTAFKIAKALSSFIEEKVTDEALYELIYPVLKAVSEINTEAVANFIALQILELDFIKDNIDKETISNILIPVLQSIKEVDMEHVAQLLIDALVNSGIFEEVITESRLSTVISLLLYNSAYQDVKIANNFEEATIILEHE